MCNAHRTSKLFKIARGNRFREKRDSDCLTRWYFATASPSYHKFKYIWNYIFKLKRYCNEWPPSQPHITMAVKKLLKTKAHAKVCMSISKSCYHAHKYFVSFRNSISLTKNPQALLLLRESTTPLKTLSKARARHQSKIALDFAVAWLQALWSFWLLVGFGAKKQCFWNSWLPDSC
jgi:hypothetical protein